MNHNYKSRFEELLDNDPTATSDATTPGAPLATYSYPSHGNVRNVCFVWEDGKRLFLNYAYLVSGEYRPSERVILLSFTSHEVTLKGIYLDGLYGELMTQITRIVVCQDVRYNATADKDQPRVNSIDVAKAS